VGAGDIDVPGGSGVHHTVARGETLWSISRAYGVSPAEIREANGLTGDAIGVGQRLFIPGAERTRPTPARPEEGRDDGRPGPGRLSWPLAGRSGESVRSAFGERSDPINGTRSFHEGIDIDSANGERALAAADGEVVFASVMSGYGTVVMLDHGGRTITLYAHLTRAVVRVGDQVVRGRTIGYVGSEGRATGPHLHFEVRLKGVPVDPLDRLP
jgi:murein DD-endopeptidase MepM/ murein hydrolase activator NlpD